MQNQLSKNLTQSYSGNLTVHEDKAQLVHACVIQIEGELRIDLAPHKPMVQSPSCFVQPQVGDFVLSYISKNEAYIIAVLESANIEKIVTLDASLININATKICITGEEIALQGGSLRRSFRNIFSSSQNYERNVEKIDRLTAGDQFVRVKGSSVQSSKNLSIIAKAVARIRGGQIHMG